MFTNINITETLDELETLYRKAKSRCDHKTENIILNAVILGIEHRLLPLADCIEFFRFPLTNREELPSHTSLLEWVKAKTGNKKSDEVEKEEEENDTNILFEKMHRLLGQYHQALHLTKSEIDAQFFQNKISQLENQFLSNYPIKIWQFYVDKVIGREPQKDHYQMALAWFVKLLKHKPTIKDERWLAYRTELRSIREKYYQNLQTILLERSNTYDLLKQHENFSNSMRKFIAKLFASSETILGEAPSCYTVVAFGSLARNEIAPFSDIEFGILIDSNVPEHIKSLVNTYFYFLLEVFRFKIASLGESGLYGSPKGLVIDDGISPIFCFDMGREHQMTAEGAFGTPHEIIANYSKALFDPLLDDELQKTAFESAELYSLLNPVYVYSNGPAGKDYKYKTGKGLFKELIDEILLLLDNLTPVNRTSNYQLIRVGKELGRIQLQSHTKELLKKFTTNIRNAPAISIKEQYISLMTYIGFDLAYLHGIPTINSKDYIYNTIQVWNSLKIENYISEADFLFFRFCFAQCLTIRALAQFHYQQQLKPEVVATHATLRSYALNWTPPNMTWWGNEYGITPPTIAFQMESQKDHVTEEDMYALNSDEYHILLGFDCLFITPLKAALENFYLAPDVALDLDNLGLRDFSKLYYQMSNEHHHASFVTIMIQYFSYAINPLDKIFTYFKKLREYDRYLFMNGLQQGNAKLGLEFYDYLLQQCDNDGYRPIRDIEQRRWLAAVKSLLIPLDDIEDAKKKKIPILFTKNLKDPNDIKPRAYTLHKRVYDQLFVDGILKTRPHSQTDGRHNAYPVLMNKKLFYWKFSPEQPATESLDEELTSLLTGELSPQTLISKLICYDENGDPTTEIVQIVDGVSGIKLDQQGIIKHPDKLNVIDKASFTRHFIRVLISNPEDDKSDDYFLVELATISQDSVSHRYILRRIDRERMYYKSDETVRQLFILSEKKYVLVKSFLFCLNQMYETLDEKVLMQLALLDADLLIRRWLEFAAREEQFYRRLFSADEFTKHLKLPEEKMSLLAVFMPTNIEREIWSRIDTLQTFVKFNQSIRENDNGQVTALKLNGMEILEHVQPTLANFYKAVFDKFPYTKKLPQLADTRFEHLPGIAEAYLKNATNGRQSLTQPLQVICKISNVLNSARDPLAIYHGKEEAALCALIRFNKMRKMSAEDVAKEIIQNKKGCWTKFEGLSSKQQNIIMGYIFDMMKIKQINSKSVLKSLLNAMSKLYLTHLDLNQFGSVLNDHIFNELIKKSGAMLIRLEMNNAQLSDASIQLISVLCPNLAYLSCQNNNKIKNVLNISLPKLEFLNLNGCKSLKKFTGEFPCLDQLYVYGSPISRFRVGQKSYDISMISTVENYNAMRLFKDEGSILKTGIERDEQFALKPLDESRLAIDQSPFSSYAPINRYTYVIGNLYENKKIKLDKNTKFTLNKSEQSSIQKACEYYLKGAIHHHIPSIEAIEHHFDVWDDSTRLQMANIYCERFQKFQIKIDALQALKCVKILLLKNIAAETELEIVLNENKIAGLLEICSKLFKIDKECAYELGLLYEADATETSYHFACEAYVTAVELGSKQALAALAIIPDHINYLDTESLLRLGRSCRDIFNKTDLAIYYFKMASDRGLSDATQELNQLAKLDGLSAFTLGELTAQEDTHSAAGLFLQAIRLGYAPMSKMPFTLFSKPFTKPDVLTELIKVNPDIVRDEILDVLNRHGHEIIQTNSKNSK